MTSQKKSRNYYDVLHVSFDAPTEIIRSSYRTLMQRLKNHPDLGGDAATAALINESYAVLTDTKRRADYDALLDAKKRIGAGRAGGPQGIRPTAPRSGTCVETPRRLLNPFRECVFCKTPHDHNNVIHPDAVCTVCASPLCPAEKHRLESIGKRAIARISEERDVMFYTAWPQSQGFAGRMEDASLNGMRVVTKQKLSEGQYIKIVGGVIEAVGDVVYYRKHSRGSATICGVAGISFVTVRFIGSVGTFISDRV